MEMKNARVKALESICSEANKGNSDPQGTGNLSSNAYKCLKAAYDSGFVADRKAIAIAMSCT